MANNRKYLGIKFPFTSKDSEGFFVDMNYDPYKEVKSDLMHLLFTPVGQRLRNPSFGSNIIRYIFDPEDTKTLTDIKIEMQEMVKRYFPGVTIDDITVTKDIENDHSALVKMKYTIDEGTFSTMDEITMTI